MTVSPAALETAGAYVLTAISTVRIRTGHDILTVKEEVGWEGGRGRDKGTQPLGCDVRQPRQVQVVQVGKPWGHSQKPG